MQGKTSKLNDLYKAYESAVLTAAHCRKIQYTASLEKREGYERFANNAARRATQIQSKIHEVKHA